MPHDARSNIRRAWTWQKTIPASPATDRYAVKALQHTITLCGGKPEVSEIDSSVRQEEYLDRKAQRV